jgi:hypothetical protein
MLSLEILRFDHMIILHRKFENTNNCWYNKRCTEEKAPMKYPLRFVWYVLRIVIVAASAFAVLAVVFIIAMDSANVYVIVTDGMKAKATDVLMPGEGADLTKFFSVAYLNKNPTQDRSQYVSYVITDFDYKINVESIWCNPWNNAATVTVVESIPAITSTGTVNQTEDKTDTQPPKWPRARYRLHCVRQNDVWRIDRIELIKSLPPEPSTSPEPSSYITASPVPTATPKPNESAVDSPGLSASVIPSATN